MWWPFDLIIFTFLVSVGALLVEIGVHWEKFKRRRILVVVTFLIAVAWGVIFYGSFIEPKILVVHNQDVVLNEDASAQLHAVVVSDIHVGPYKNTRWVERVVESVMVQNPDIVFLAGDFIFNNSDQVKYLTPLNNLSAPMGIYAVTGNHDYIDDSIEEIIQAFESMNIEVLENESVSLQVQEIKQESKKELVIAGVSDLWFESDIKKTMLGLSLADNVVLLSHNPDVVLFEESEIADIVVSAHTHGGQIRLPWLGSVPSIPTVLGNDYDRGLFTYMDQLLFITSGVGETGTRARLFNPPEITNLFISF
jgi:uncharacterized protein